MEAQPFTFAAIIVNTRVTELFIEINSKMMEISYHKGLTHLDTAYENMHLETI